MNSIRKIKLVIGILLLVLGAMKTTYAGETPNFSEIKVEEAIRRARAEGKLIFMDFYADWCTPCKWMDKTTFVDEHVKTTLDKDFISIKINIDGVEGFQMKNKYEINFLPTMLILNSNGKLIDRLEQTVTPEELVSILSLHNSPENKIIIRHDFNKSPKNIHRDDPSEESPWMLTHDEYKRYKESSLRRNYRVQVGVYTEYADARNKVDELRDLFIEPVVVLNDFRDEKVLFKVLLGQFETIEEANSFCKILASNFGIKAIVN